MENDENGYNVELEEFYPMESGKSKVWRINPDAEVEILESVFGKHLLRDGVIVKRRNNTYAIVIGDYLYSKMGHILLSDYETNLTCPPSPTKDLDIMVIYKATGYGNIFDILDGNSLEVIAERPEEVKEMTLDQICKELGYNVKIVKED